MFIDKYINIYILTLTDDIRSSYYNFRTTRMSGYHHMNCRDNLSTYIQDSALLLRSLTHQHTTHVDRYIQTLTQLRTLSNHILQLRLVEYNGFL
jgi:hypothetical protein